MRPSVRRAAFALMLVAVPVPQDVPTRRLATPEQEYAEAFSQIAGLRELRDGRVIVSDSRDRTLQLIDLRAATSAAIGREGAGPLEWASPGRLISLPGDSTLMPDPLNSRLLVLGPDGKAAYTYRPTADATNGLMDVRGSDSRGRLYYQGTAIQVGPSGPLAADSAPIIRFDPATRRHDTVAFVGLPKTSAATRRGGDPQGQRATQTAIAPLPFAPADDWGVLPDGRVAIARVQDYHLEIVQSDGHRTAGAPVRFTPVRVTERDKAAFREARAAAARGRTVLVNGRPIVPPPPPEPAEWPETKPPFARAAMWIAPTEQIWVIRSRSASDSIPTADVFGSRGELMGKVVFPANTQVVGFGAQRLYLVRMADDGLQFLGRYPLP